MGLTKRISGLCAAAIMTAAAASAGSLIVSDFSFQNYSVGAGGYQYSPSFAGYVPGWTFDAAAGIASSGSGFNPPNNPPDGAQSAFLQSNGAQISQSIGGFSIGVQYTLDLWVGTRFNSGCCDGDAGVNFFLDGNLIGSTGALTSFTSFQHFTTPSFTVGSAGAHTLSLVNTSLNGDHTAFVDAVGITFPDAVGGVPEPAALYLSGGALALLGMLRRKRV